MVQLFKSATSSRKRKSTARTRQSFDLDLNLIEEMTTDKRIGGKTLRYLRSPGSGALLPSLPLVTLLLCATNGISNELQQRRYGVERGRVSPE